MTASLKLYHIDRQILKQLSTTEGKSTRQISKDSETSYPATSEHLYKLIAMGRASLKTVPHPGGAGKKHMWTKK